jgi:transposase
LPAIHVSLREMFSQDVLHCLVAQHPYATLRQLCQQMQLEHGTALSTTSMCRLLKQYGIARRRTNLAKADSTQMLLGA